MTTTKLFVGNLPGGTKSEDLLDIFEKYGSVTECDVIKNYAFVHYSSEEDAKAAVDGCHEANVKGNLIRVQISTSNLRQTAGMGNKDNCFRCGGSGHWSKDCTEPMPSKKLFVGNLPDGTTNDELREIFAEHGDVAECDVIKNYAFIHYDSIEDSKRAQKNVHRTDFRGNIIRVEFSSSDNRKAPGMGNRNECFRCGGQGHWSKDCSAPMPRRGGGGAYGGGGGGGRGARSGGYGGGYGGGGDFGGGHMEEDYADMGGGMGYGGMRRMDRGMGVGPWGRSRDLYEDSYEAYGGGGGREYLGEVGFREMAAAPARLRTRPYSDPYERRSMMMASAYQDDYYEEEPAFVGGANYRIGGGGGRLAAMREAAFSGGGGGLPRYGGGGGGRGLSRGSGGGARGSGGTRGSRGGGRGGRGGGYGGSGGRY